VKKKTRPGNKKPIKPFDIPKISLVIAFVSFFALGILYLVKPFTSIDTTCANSISCISDLSGEYEGETSGTFMGQAVTAPTYLSQGNAQPFVLGDNTGSNKRIFVDLANQRLYAKEGDAIIHEFPVSTGLWGRTPTGDFTIWIKLRYTRMQGGSKEKGTYYNLPNVPFTMFFHNKEIPKWRGYGIHGAYWHNNFGHPMSHGCINMKTEDVEKIYNWAQPSSDKHTVYASDENPGTPITIYGTAPLQ